MVKLILVFSSLFIAVFLLFPSITYTTSWEGCSNNPFANCSPASIPHIGKVFGGVKYIISSFKAGNFYMTDTLVEQVPIVNGGSSEEFDQFFRPLWAIIAASAVSLPLTVILYLKSKKKT